MGWLYWTAVLSSVAVVTAIVTYVVTRQYYYRVRLASGGTVPVRTMGCGNGEHVLVYVNQKEIDMLETRDKQRRALYENGEDTGLTCY